MTSSCKCAIHKAVQGTGTTLNKRAQEGLGTITSNMAGKTAKNRHLSGFYFRTMIDFQAEDRDAERLYLAEDTF